MTDDRDFTSYVAARWGQLVRGMVGMGAPLDAAHGCVADTLSRCHDEWDDRDEWADLDVHVVRDLLDSWHDRRDAWWDYPVPAADAEVMDAAGWPELEPRLDRLEVADREALVLTEVLGMGPDQVREVTRVETRPRVSGVAADLHTALELLPVDPPPVEAMIRGSEQRQRRRRLTAYAVGAGVLAVAAVVALLVVRHEPEPEPERPQPFATVRSVAYDNPSPVAWYASGVLYLPQSQIDLRDVRTFAQWGDGAVYLDLQGNLVTVDESGRRTRIATLGGAGTFAVHDATERLAWVDPTLPEFVLYDLDTHERLIERALPEEPSRVVSLDDEAAIVGSGERLLSVDLEDGDLEQSPDQRMPGELDRYEGLVLAREGGATVWARIRLYDTNRSIGTAIPLDVGDPRNVSDARFGPDGSVMLLVEPRGARFSEVRRCEPPYDDCRLVAYFPAGGARALLAQ